jgi:ribosomal protein S19E (S16A)
MRLQQLISEQAGNINKNAVDCVYGMNIDCSMKEAKRLYAELGNSPLLRKQIEKALTNTVTAVLNDIKENGVVEAHWSENDWINKTRKHTLDHIASRLEEVNKIV